MMGLGNKNTFGTGNSGIIVFFLTDLRGEGGGKVIFDDSLVSKWQLHALCPSLPLAPALSSHQLPLQPDSLQHGP